MGLSNDIRRKMDRKTKELGELRERRNQVHSTLREMETQIREVKAAIAIYEEVLRMAPDDAEDDVAQPTMRVGSGVALAREALRKNGKAMHIAKLLEAIGKPDTHDQKVSLSSSLAAYVRKGQVFTRPEPNVFGLVEWQQSSTTLDEQTPSERDVDEVLEKVR